MPESTDPDVIEAWRRRDEADKRFEEDLETARGKMLTAQIIAELERRDRVQTNASGSDGYRRPRRRRGGVARASSKSKSC